MQIFWKKCMAVDKVRHFQLGRPNFSNHLDPCEHDSVVQPAKVTEIYRIWSSSWTIASKNIEACQSCGCSLVSTYI
jgi:hypothetical protein